MNHWDYAIQMLFSPQNLVGTTRFKRVFTPHQPEISRPPKEENFGDGIAVGKTEE